MLNEILIAFYERDIRKLAEEIRSFQSDENLWKTIGSIRNPAGNLALHIIGGTNFLIGATLAETGYIRNRDLEFSARNITREKIISDLEALVPVVTTTLNSVNMDKEYPRMFDDAIRTNGYVLTQLALHLNYHLGQVNYLRRALEG